MAARKVPSDDQIREAFSDVGDALQRAVVLSSDRVQSVFEDAVLRGRMTRRDAEELASSLVALGRDQALELRSEVDAIARAIPGKVVDAVDPRAKRRKKKKRDEEQRREAERFVRGENNAPATAAPNAKPARAATPKAKPAAKPKVAKSTAAADPSTLSAKDLIALVATLPPSELKALRTKEAAGKARSTVLAAIDKRTGA